MTYEEWYQLLEQKPDDWTTREVFCDWLEEEGSEFHVRVQRWMIRNRLHPIKATWVSPIVLKHPLWPEGVKKSWDWRFEDTPEQGYYAPSLPRFLLGTIEDLITPKDYPGREVKEYATLQAAEDALVKGCFVFQKITNQIFDRWIKTKGGWKYQ